MSQDRERLNLVLSVAREGFWDWNLKTDQLYLSPRYCEVTGYSPIDTLFDTAFMKLIIHPDDHQLFFHALEALHQGREESLTIEYRMISKDGVMHWIECRCRKVEHDEDGTVSHLIGTIVDITDKKKREHDLHKLNHALLASNERMHLIMAATNTSIWEYDVITDTNFWPDKLWRMYGLEPYSCEATHENWLNTIIPEDRERIAQITGEDIRNGVEFNNIWRVLDPDGAIRWLMAKGTPFKDADGKVLRYAGIVLDITDRKVQEEALQESENRFRNLFEKHSSVILVLDPDTSQIVDANQAAATFYGWPLEKLRQMPFRRVTMSSPETVKRNLERFRAAEKEQGSFHHCHRHILADGSIRDVEVFSCAIPYHGKPLIYSIINDITERTQIEHALRDSEKKFRSITEQIAEMVFVTDDKGALTYVSPVVEKIFGYSASEVIRHLFTEYLAEEEVSRALAILANTLRDYFTDQVFEGRFRKKNGSLFYGEVHVRSYRDQDSSGMIGLIRDISERKAYQQELLESRQFLKTIYDDVNYSIFVVDVLPDRSYLFKGINPMHEKLTGIKSEQISGKKLEEILSPHFAALVMHHYDECIREGHPIRYEELLPFKGKETLWETVLNPVRNESGTICRIIGTSIDITERRQAEEERAQLEVQLQQSQKMEMIGRLAGGIAHDFNNMLTVILGHSEMAIELFDPSQQAYADLEAIRQAGARSADLTRQLLAFARKQIVIPKILELNSVIEHMLPMLRRLIGENIALVWIPDCKNSHLKMDPSQIDQILVNLCVNARDAITGNGTITLRTECLALPDIGRNARNSGESPVDYVRLSIRDDGGGIDKDDLHHIFEPFFTTKEQGKGTGLGLSTVYGIVKQNNGTIECQSEPGQGTIFTIQLPRYNLQPQVEQQTQAEQFRHHGHQTILLVEDQPAILKLCKSMLERNGYAVLTAESPAEALRKEANYKGTLDLLLTDVIMPEMNGSELSRQLQALRPELKTLFMSGYTDDVIIHNTLLDSGVNFIQKPFTMKSLITIVDTILNPDECEPSGATTRPLAE